MGIGDEIAKQCQSIAIPCRYRVRSDILLDNSGDDPQRNAMFLIQVGNGKADIIQNIGLAIVAFYQMVYSQDRLCHNSHFHFFSR